MSQKQTEKVLAIRKGQPITVEEVNLTFYPITMNDYEEFIATKDAFLLRQGTLPVKYLPMRFLSAVWAMEADSIMESGTAIGLLDRILRYLYLCLRIEYKPEEVMSTVYCRTDKPTELAYIVVTQNENAVKITPQDFSTYVRPLIAEQNGLELPDESANLDFIRAAQKMAELKQKKANIKLKNDINDLISSVAYQSHIQEKDIANWTVREFEYRRKAIDRDKHFLISAIAETAGFVKFENGNPNPSWCFDKDEEICAGAVSINVLAAHNAVLGDPNAAIVGNKK